MTSQHISAQLAQGARCVGGYSTARRIAQQISIWLLPPGLPSSRLGLEIVCREEGIANERGLLDPPDKDLSGGEKGRTCNSPAARCRISDRTWSFPRNTRCVRTERAHYTEKTGGEPALEPVSFVGNKRRPS